MRRYGWSSGHQQLSPFASTLSGQDGSVPEVTDSDYDYITSADLNGRTRALSPTFDDYDGSDFRSRNDDELDEIPQDDVLLLRHGREMRKEFFPAYVIGDGKMFVGDIRDRIQVIYNLSDADRDRVRLRYKGKPLDDDQLPACRAGVKNNSEVVYTLPGEEPESFVQPKSPTTAAASAAAAASRRNNKSNRPRSPKVAAGGPSASTGNLDVPGRGRAADHRPGSTSRAHSVASGTSGVSGASNVSNISKMAPPATISGSAMDKLNHIAQHFDTKLLPLCEEFLAHPPSDAKKRADDHSKISETVFQHVLLKLDEVDTGGDDTIRARRKALVNEVQETLKAMDAISKTGK